MSDTNTLGQAPEEIAPTTPEPAQEPAPEAPETTPEQPEAPQSVDQLPEWAQKQIRDLRDENAKNRVKAKTTAEQAQAERDQLIQQIGKTLGLVPDESNPEALLKAAQEQAESANAERDKMAAQLATYQRNEAVNAALADEKGNPIKVDTTLLNALLAQDNAFNQLDLTASDYKEQVSKHIAETLSQHPQLKAQAAPPASGVDPTTTSNANNENKLYTREELRTMPASEVNRLFREGKLNHLMTK